MFYLNKMLVAAPPAVQQDLLTGKNNPLLSISKNRHTMVTYVHAILYKIIITMCAVHTLVIIGKSLNKT